MKKLFVIAVAACVAFSFTSCKSSKDSAYKTAYDEARQAELAEGNGQESEAVEIAPVANQNVDTTYRTEKVVLSSGAEGSLKAFSVVCGSYSRKEGAENIRHLPHRLLGGTVGAVHSGNYGTAGILKFNG